MVLMSETVGQRAKRERQRLLFDAVAHTYRQTRPQYPEEVVQWIAETARLDEDAAVLEVGCGTGQLTAELARLPLRITAIDIGPSMIEIARRHVADGAVVFAISSFEDLSAPDASFDLVVSASAFHWIDPDVFWTRSARLLRPCGWLAIAYVGEVYDEPFSSALRDAWVRRSADCGAWMRTRVPTIAERIAGTGLFEPAVEQSHTRRADLSPDGVMGLERTRATYLDYDPDTRASFDAELRAPSPRSPQSPPLSGPPSPWPGCVRDNGRGGLLTESGTCGHSPCYGVFVNAKGQGMQCFRYLQLLRQAGLSPARVNAYLSHAPGFQSSLCKAIAAPEEDTVARAALGFDVVDHYLNFACTERRLFDQVVTCYEHEWLFERG
jgi:ubiquinone/menaquinone biosynthesis C-methylase UbiE